MSEIILFGEDGEWGISLDDGCLQFHPQMSIDPCIKATHIWREAFEELEKIGGYSGAVSILQGKSEKSRCKQTPQSYEALCEELKKSGFVHSGTMVDMLNKRK